MAVYFSFYLLAEFGNFCLKLESAPYYMDCNWPGYFRRKTNFGVARIWR